NRSVSKLVPPETDVQRFFKERVVRKANSSVTPPELYEDYLDWCGQLGKEPLAQPIFYRDCLEMGIERHKAGNRTRYMGIALRNLPESWEDKKLPALAPQAA